MHILGPHPGPVDSETMGRGEGPAISVLTHSPSDSDEVGGPLDKVQREKSLIKWGLGVLEEVSCFPEAIETWVLFAEFSVSRPKSGVK